MAPCGKEQGVFAGATARIENRADDLIGGGPEGRLGLADVPGRAAGIRAAKVFAVVCQDVVREKISLSRDFLFDLPVEILRYSRSFRVKQIDFVAYLGDQPDSHDWDPWPSYLRARFAEHALVRVTRAPNQSRMDARKGRAGKEPRCASSCPGFWQIFGKFAFGEHLIKRGKCESPHEY